ncbi:MAG: hypothetical protein IT307_13060 [Chloroflexi bacterium]|nr:hypothetical protein [Chloroflexota bacterium]
MPFSWVLALYVHSRDLDRQARADQYEVLSDEMLLHAYLAGAKQHEADRFTRGLREQALSLRRPEAKVDIAPLLTPGQRAFIAAARLGADDGDGAPRAD